MYKNIIISWKQLKHVQESAVADEIILPSFVCLFGLNDHIHKHWSSTWLFLDRKLTSFPALPDTRNENEQILKNLGKRNLRIQNKIS